MANESAKKVLKKNAIVLRNAGLFAALFFVRQVLDSSSFCSLLMATVLKNALSAPSWKLMCLARLQGAGGTC